MQHGGRRQRSAARRSSPRRRAVAIVACAGAVALAGCAGQSAPGDPASLVTDRLFEAFNAQDAEEVAAIFGDDVAFTLESGKDVVGADAATFWQGYFGVETARRITDAFQPSAGRTYFTTEFTRSSSQWASTLVFEVEMEGGRLVRMGARHPQVEEVLATAEIDELHEAFNAQDPARLTETFGGMAYRSASGVESSGPAAAAQWADGFRSTVARTSDVYELRDGVFGFVSEHTDQASGRSTAYTVELEVDVTGGVQIISMAERRRQT